MILISVGADLVLFRQNWGLIYLNNNKSSIISDITRSDRSTGDTRADKLVTTNHLIPRPQKSKKKKKKYLERTFACYRKLNRSRWSVIAVESNTKTWMSSQDRTLTRPRKLGSASKSLEMNSTNWKSFNKTKKILGK